MGVHALVRKVGRLARAQAVDEITFERSPLDELVVEGLLFELRQYVDSPADGRLRDAGRDRVVAAKPHADWEVLLDVVMVEHCQREVLQVVGATAPPSRFPGSLNCR